MADENQPEVEGMSEGEDDVSWEDAFKEMAEAQKSDEDDEPVHEAAPADMQDDVIGVSEEADSPSIDIDFLLDISLDVTVEVGRTKMMVNDLLQLQQGSVIDLDKMVGEPFEVYVNKKLMAFGEVVVVNEKFGIRLTDIIDPKERIQQLG
ncbi:MAG: flagellar motor switch protein FliN [Candidatus Sumerlaeia bacterium]